VSWCADWLAGDVVRKVNISPAHSVHRLRLIHSDKLLLLECGNADLPDVKLLQVSSLSSVPYVVIIRQVGARRIAVTRYVRSTKLLYAGPG